MGQLHRDRVLLVDDEPQVLIALEDLLSDRFSVVKTTSPDHALRVLAEERDIAVVVTDQRMPKMTGDQMLSHLGPACKALRILLTGFADLNAVIRAVNDGGIFAYITKPWDADDLRSKVDHAAERFRSANELVNEHRLLNDLLVNSPDAISLKDRELRFVQVNRAFARQHGAATEAELLGKTLSDVLPDRALASRIEGNERQILDSRTPRLDVLAEFSGAAAQSWYSESKAPILGTSGKAIGLLGIARDVTDRVRHQQALAQSESTLRSQTQLLHAILNSLAEGVLVVNCEGEFLLFSQQARQLLGSGPEGLTAQTWARACGVYQLDRKTPLAAEDDPLLRAMRGEPWWEIEVFVKNEYIPGSHVMLIGTPLMAADGTITGSIALLRDVSVHKALEQRLAQAHKLEAVGRLAGGIAHDFNNLLSVIQGCTQLMLQTVKETDVRDDLGQVLGAAERAANLTKQLMLFSRQQITQPEVLQINEIVPQLTSMLRRVLGEDVKCETSLIEGLQYVVGDRSQIEQIVVNLSINARDAMPNGGELRISTRNVHLSERELLARPDVAPGDFVELGVSDTGVGMDEDTQARMYEPFYTTKGVGKGTGLGLATVYGIVRQSHGFVTCDSQVGRGTTFKIYFPAARRPSSNAPPIDAVEASSCAPAVGTILLVEDEDPVRMVASRMLRTQGHTVLEARLPSEALKIHEQCPERIDLLVTDIVMPEMSGTQLAAALKRIQPQLRVLYISGYAGAAGPVMDAKPRNTWFLEKPFSTKTLLERVAEALETGVQRTAVR